MGHDDRVSDQIEPPKPKRHRHAIRYLHDAMRYKPDATPKELRREVRRLMKQDGHGMGWIFLVLKIVFSLLPLFFQRPKA